MSRRQTIIAGLAALVLVLAVACGGGDSDDSGDGSSGSSATEAPDNSGGEPENTATAEPSGGGSASPGSATLTLGDDSWTFNLNKCFFEGESSDEAVVFATGGTVANPGNGMLAFSVGISDSALRGGLAHTIRIFSFEADNGEAVKETIVWTTSTTLSDDDDGFIQIDGKRVTADALFDNELTSETESVPGTLVVVCP